MADDHIRLPEQERNSLLRQVDWRFLLPLADRPRVLNLAGGRLATAVRLISDAVGDGKATADLVVVGNPTHEQLGRASKALRPGGALYCQWTLPAPMRPRSARIALARAGFQPLVMVWPGPPSRGRPPQFWLPVESPEAAAHLLAERPARTGRERALRGAWHLAAGAGALAPLGAVARWNAVPEAAVESDEIGALLEHTAARQWLLLTGGKRTINKVVGLPFAPDSESPELVVKFARVPEAEPSIAHEASVLRTIAENHLDVPDVPRVVAAGRRVGRTALAETAVHGTRLMSTLSFDTLPQLAAGVTKWLVSLAGRNEAHPTALWQERLVEVPVRIFERQFETVIDGELLARVRRRLAYLGPLPLVVEHRDCAPWNIVLTERGTPALLDWESAEPAGLPMLDLVYFLTNAAFVLEGALESGRTRESYRGLLSASTGTGRVAEKCLADYCQALGLDPAQLPALRLLTWIVHARSDVRHVELELGDGPPPSALRRSTFLGLIEEEVRCAAA